jgi:phosphosulfolactate synthase
MLSELNKDRVDSKKPRKEGLTCIVDRLQVLDKENFEALSEYIDIVKIYNVIPIIIPETVLEKRIKFYHDFGIQISTGSTITELAILENYFDKFVKESKDLGFDIIEIAENNIQLDIEQKKKIVNAILSNGLNFHWKVGRKDPRHQLGVEDTLSKIDEAISKIGSEKVIIEANEGINVGIYDERGSVKWNFVGALTSKYPPPVFIFESPIESQQSALIAEFGQRVNLAGINLDVIAFVESQRRGFMSKAAFGISYLRKEPESGPASKFIYYIIKTKNPIDQGELISLSHLPRRTIQNAVEELKGQGLIVERNSLEDARKKLYTPIHSDWL